MTLIITCTCLHVHWWWFHVVRALTIATHSIALYLVTLTTIVGLRIWHLLYPIWWTTIPTRIILLLVLSLSIIEITLAVQVRTAMLHTWRGLLDFACGEFLEVCNTRLKTFNTLFLTSIGSRYSLLLVNVIIMMSIILWVLLIAWCLSLVVRRSTLTRLACALSTVGGSTTAAITILRFHRSDFLKMYIRKFEFCFVNLFEFNII